MAGGVEGVTGQSDGFDIWHALWLDVYDTDDEEGMRMLIEWVCSFPEIRGLIRAKQRYWKQKAQ